MADDGNHQRKPDFRTAVEDLKALATVLYAPSAELAPRFARFLREVFGGDEDLIGFVRRFAGYSLTGSAEERVFAILHGRGKNGKTTLIELLESVMGHYATATDSETILAKRHQGVGNSSVPGLPSAS